VPKASDPFILELIQSFEEAAFGLGYGVLISSVGPEPARMSLCVQRMMERNAEGLAAMIFNGYPLLIEELKRSAIPYVCIDRGNDDPTGRGLRLDHFDGVRQVVQHLAVLGHRKIGFVLEPGKLFSAQSAVAAFSQSLAECGIATERSWIVLCEESDISIDQAAEKLLVGDQPPTAVISSGSASAMAVLQAASRFALRVPEDLSIVGFGYHLPTIRPLLTSALISPSEMAVAAVEAIRADASHPAPGRKITIRPHLVIRESTGFPRGAMMDLQTRQNPSQQILARDQQIG
jgi:LacI family transcriptional regulator